jgi:hypothetical protein
MGKVASFVIFRSERLWNRLLLPVMGKIGWAILITLCALVGADEYFNHGRYGDSMIGTLRQMQHALGW